MRWLWLAALLVAGPPGAQADDLYLVDHPDAAWWLSGQLNAIWQFQPGFHSPYVGPNSFLPSDHHALSYVATVFAGYQLTPTTAIVVTGESAGGDGLSTALGLAGFTNLDVVRNPSLGPTPYVGRAFIHQVIPLGGGTIDVERNPLDILGKRAARRIEIHAGKMSAADYFDVNTIGSDSHFRFMNWTIDNNGAWDYAADTRGYTLGLVVEYYAPLWAVRLGELLMPTVANGIDYDFDIGNARGQYLELEARTCLAGRPGIVRLLGYVNLARMGNYDESNAEFRQGITDVPDIAATRVAGRTKYGVGLNVEQELTEQVHAFARLGWSDGRNESFAYTEVDNTVLAGFDVRLRTADKLGVAAVSNGLLAPHRTYLALGGKGFLLGDGKLSYGREDFFEAYYTARAYRGVYPAVDLQVIANPGYNTDRGPAVVGSVRLHLEI